MMAPFAGVHLHHVARETDDVQRLTTFYQQIFGFQKLETPAFGEFEVVWLTLPPSYSLHVIQRDRQSGLPESPFTVPPQASRRDPSSLWRGHHLSFRVLDYDSAIALLREKNIQIFEKTQQDGKIKQAFFFDPDGNGLEIGNWPVPS
ncbi:hypothetical protein O6H91_23G027000 [Diphasiastrum complanatum]|uniref:Uncharacterized protein n=1 Tax=Diphasiastrum complanatum TaxID=34168 RepID=A0ACC2A991_DIPCM|nr:hypothetical protein O6H91_23G027000 [Diphasiastrum complanatum]